MRIKEGGIAVVALVVLALLGVPVGGLVALAGMAALAVAGFLLVVGAEKEAGSAFALGLVALAGSAVFNAIAGAGGLIELDLAKVAGGLVCLGVPLLALGALHVVARGLATLPDRPPPRRPLEWRRAEVIEPD